MKKFPCQTTSFGASFRIIILKSLTQSRVKFVDYNSLQIYLYYNVLASFGGRKKNHVQQKTYAFIFQQGKISVNPEINVKT